jgi:hypothetical protein
MRSLALWADTEFYLGTAQGPRRWDAFWATVRATRRRYALICVAAGIVVGGGVGWFAANVATRPFRNLVPVLLGYGSALAVGWLWGRLLATTIAPLLLRNGQRLARVGYVIAQTLVLGASSFVPVGSVAWAVVAGLLVAVPWWISAAQESRRPVPPYPPEWTRFDSG